MYSECQQAFSSMIAGIRKEKKLFAAFIIWCILCVFAGVSNLEKAYANYGISISVADLLILQQHPWNTGIMIVPMVVFLVMRCKKECRNMQFILRYRCRKKALIMQLMESGFYAVGISGLLMGIQIIISFYKKVPAINWKTEGSLFWVQTGEVTDQSILTVIIMVFAMYLIKIMILLFLLDIFMWYPNIVFTLWMVLILIAGIEQQEFSVFYRLFAVQYSLWMLPGRHAIIILSGFLILLLEYKAGNVLVQKTDIFV